MSLKQKLKTLNRAEYLFILYLNGPIIDAVSQLQSLDQEVVQQW